MEFRRGICRKEKIKEMGGRIRMLIKKHVWKALKWVRREDVEIRQAQVGRWVEELEGKEGY